MHRKDFERIVSQQERTTNRSFPLLERSGEDYLDLYVQKKWEMWQACITWARISGQFVSRDCY